MSRIPRLAGAVIGATVFVAACGGADSTGTIRLGQDELAPDVDDIQSPAADTESVRDLTFATLDGGEDRFDDHLGRPLVVNFFASWCAPCRAEMPEFQALFEEFEDRVGFLGISRDDTASPSLELIAEVGVTYPTGWDADQTLFPRLGGFAMPTTLFVDADGNVVDRWAGSLTGDDLRERVEALL